MPALAPELPSKTINLRGRALQVFSHPAVADTAQASGSAMEHGLLRFFDAVLPSCDHLIDCGANIGLATLYAAQRGVRVTAFEPVGRTFQLLSANVEVNPALASRIRLYGHGIGPRDERVTRHDAAAGHGASPTGAPWQYAYPQSIELCAAGDVLRRVGLTRRTLLKLDIRGGEYAVLPTIADLLKQRKPWLHVAFDASQTMADRRDPYAAAIRRLNATLQVAEATACYRYMHLFAEGDWCTIGTEQRLNFLHQYLLQPKAVPGGDAPHYGYVDAMAFSDEELPGAVDHGPVDQATRNPAMVESAALTP